MGKFGQNPGRPYKRNKRARSRKNFLCKHKILSNILEEILDQVVNHKYSTSGGTNVNSVTGNSICQSEQVKTSVTDVTSDGPQPGPSQIYQEQVDSSPAKIASDEYHFIWGSNYEYNRVKTHALHVEVEPDNVNIFGYRIVNIKHLLKQAMRAQSLHSQNCTGDCLEYKEEKRDGLASTFTYQCNICNKEIMIDSEDKATPIINQAAVWGALSIGSSYAHLAELLSVLDIPPLSGSKFFEIQRALGYVWKESLWEVMQSAGEEERIAALQRNDVDADGVPYITVCLDGGRSKRSYGHSYNAASGVAVIIGRHTGKILFLGVRNKFCSICAKSECRGKGSKEHLCFKNWQGSSSTMESDIIVEGFNNSISMHNLKYKKFIADGDSTVFARIKKDVAYGTDVIKIECTNHALKNFGKNLLKIKNDTKGISLAARKMITNVEIDVLRKSAQATIYANAHGDIQTLKEDIRNIVNHTYGNHSKSKEYLCKAVGNMSNNRTNDLVATGAHHHLYAAINMLLTKSHLLIDNETNNRAELFMSILARFNMGKRLNLIQRDSFQTRSFLSGLCYNEGQSWHTIAWKKHFKRSPGKNLKHYMKMQAKRAEQKREHSIGKAKVARKLKLPKAKRTAVDYGSDIAEIDLSEEDLKEEVKNIIGRLHITFEEQLPIEKETVRQFNNTRYASERKHRLTASNFGAVVERKESTSCDVLVKSILQHKSFTTPAMEYGIINENVAISQFMEVTGKVVRPSGLFIDTQFSFLAASPDGIINENEIIEVKCLHTIWTKGITLKEAVDKKQVSCLHLQNDKIVLKKNHNYYYQIQGQLAITKRTTCFFIVYSGDKNELHFETINFDESFWTTIMLPKLTKFYENCLGPEIILNRRLRNLKCRDPKYILDMIKKK